MSFLGLGLKPRPPRPLPDALQLAELAHGVRGGHRGEGFLLELGEEFGALNPQGAAAVEEGMGQGGGITHETVGLGLLGTFVFASAKGEDVGLGALLHIEDRGGGILDGARPSDSVIPLGGFLKARLADVGQDDAPRAVVVGDVGEGIHHEAHLGVIVLDIFPSDEGREGIVDHEVAAGGPFEEVSPHLGLDHPPGNEVMVMKFMGTDHPEALGRGGETRLGPEFLQGARMVLGEDIEGLLDPPLGLEGPPKRGLGEEAGADFKRDEGLADVGLPSDDELALRGEEAGDQLIGALDGGFDGYADGFKGRDRLWLLVPLIPLRGERERVKMAKSRGMLLLETIRDNESTMRSTDSMGHGPRWALTWLIGGGTC